MERKDKDCVGLRTTALGLLNLGCGLQVLRWVAIPRVGRDLQVPRWVATSPSWLASNALR